MTYIQRFPNFEFALGECAITWLPPVINWMGEEFEDRRDSVGYLKDIPAFYWNRQGFSDYQNE